MGDTVGGKKEHERESNGGIGDGDQVGFGRKGGGDTSSEGIIIGKVKVGKEKWKIIGVYVNGDIEGKLQRVGEWGERKEGGRLTVIGGDFNARTEEEGGGMGEWGVSDEEEEKARRSKDGKVNREGRVLVDFVEERGWSIFIGVVKRDEEDTHTREVGGIR